MAKTESTAVNDLIKIAATQTPLRKDPSEDLMFTVPPKKDRSSKHAMSPRGAEVSPLPRDRAPHGTQEHAVAMPARLSEPAIEPIATRATRPSLPPPTRSSQPPLSRPVMPSEYPIVSAVHSLPMAPAPQPIVEDSLPWADDGFDVDVAPFHGDSTAQVAKHRTNVEWMIKLLPVAGLMIVLGVLVGGYLVFDGQGGKQRHAEAPVGTVEVKVVAEEAPVAGAASEPVAAAASEPVVAAASEPVGVAVTPPNLAAPSAAEPTPTAEPTPAAAPTIAVTASTPPVASAPVATAAVTTPAPTTAAIARRPSLVDVRIDSKPSGATVMLVDRGKQTFLGTTPISTAVDPSRTYDVVFTHPRRKPQIEPLDPKATTRLAVELGKPGNRAKPELAKPAPVASFAVAKVETSAKPVAVKAPVAVTPPVAKVAKPAKIIEPTWDTQIEKAAKPEPTKIETTEPAKVETAPVVKAEKAVGGNGVLMISSKPPCEIHVDGKATGLMTPQRAMSLPAGKHKITLVNPAQKIKKSFAVEITTNESTKVIQDLTELMK